ncbi:MAG TPA: thioredoxin family protein [Thermoplasmatales archaeon]|nr:thioredoxin family protein [Thermoplasmatales archaeon]
MKHLAVIFIVVLLLAMMSGCLENGETGSSDSTITHSVGTGSNDFWTVYPAQHPKSGQSVSHPPWVKNKLKDGPLIILAHSTNCQPCIVQQADLEAVLPGYQNQIEYVDILTDGSDDRAWDVYNMYYPQGGQWYIPLTVVISQASVQGETEVIWHSRVSTTGKAWLRTYIENAIAYYEG